MIHYIYKITLLKGDLANHYYIGKRSAPKAKTPFTDGYAGSGNLVRRYYKKYGKVLGETYTKECLEMNSSMEENAKREAFWVGDLYKTDPLCLNLCGGGYGGTMSEESKIRHREGLKNRVMPPCSEETKKKISLANTGKKRSAEWVEANRQRQIERCKNEEYRKHLAEINKGKKRSEEAKRKTSESMMGHKVSEETKKKIGEANRNRKYNTENFKRTSVYQFSKDGLLIQKWESVKDAKLNLGINNIFKVLDNPNKTAGGYIWKRAAA